MKKIIAFASVAALLVSAVPASALGCFGFFCQPQSESNVTVNNDNWASVSNTVVTVASTGENSISGGDGGNGGSANGGGEAGNGGDGLAGMIVTGDAMSLAEVINDINSNRTRVSAPCVDCAGDVTVNNVDNGAKLRNKLVTLAETGENGVTGGDGGNGGSVTAAQQQPMPCFGFGCCGPSQSDCPCPEAGDGGDGEGGVIQTGDAYADARLVNIVNANVTRVRR